MEIEDEDVVVRGTDLQKYLNAVGYSEFQVSERNTVDKLSKSNDITMDPKYSRKMNRSEKNYKKDFGFCVTLIKIILESHLMFKEDMLFIKEFIPSDHIESSLFFTKWNRFTLFILCIICALLNIFFSKYCDKWTIVGMLSLWFGFVIMEILHNLNKKRSIKIMFLATIKSMEKLSMLIQKTTHFLHECDNRHNYHTSYNGANASKNDIFRFLQMPEFKSLFLSVIQDLINTLIKNISEVHTFFPLKDSVKNVAYLYLTDCKIDLNDISLENIDKAKYTYFLLQSEFLKQSGLCLCPVLWTPNSFSQMNYLINIFGELEKIYSNSYDVLFEEYNIYSMFKNNNKMPDKNPNTNSDLKLRVFNVRQFLQNMMVRVRYMEDSVEKSSKCCIDDINNTLNILVKEVNELNELVSTLQIYALKTNNDNKKDKTYEPVEIIEPIDTEINEPIKVANEDELFFGVSEELTEEITNTLCFDEIFDKSNNQNFMSELKIALKKKQDEWKQRENKLLEKHPQLTNLLDEQEFDQRHNDYINKVRKVASDLPLDENNSMQLPSRSLANEIAMVASKWNTVIESFSDESDSDVSVNSTNSIT